MWNKQCLSIKDCKRDKRCQDENRQIMYEVTGLKQNRPNTFQDALYNDYNKKALVKFIFSIWGDEKYATILQKELRVNCKEICFLYRVE